MATLYITEFSGPAGDMQVPREPPVATQTIAMTTTSGQSSAFNASTVLIQLHADANCSIAFSTNPTAVQTARRMAAGETRIYGVPPSASFKVAAITNS